MASTRVNHQTPAASGSAITWTAVDLVNGSNFVPNPGRLILFRNTTASASTVTAVTPATRQGLAIGDVSFVVPAAVAGAPGLMAWHVDDWTDFLDGAGQVGITASTAVDVAVLQA